MELKPKKCSCWECKYIIIGGISFLGKCSYFEKINKENKEIPPSLVDIGCKFFEKKG